MKLQRLLSFTALTLLTRGLACFHSPSCPSLLLLTFGRVIEALQLDTALCCSLPLRPGACQAVLCWQGDDGDLIKRALKRVEQPA